MTTALGPNVSSDLQRAIYHSVSEMNATHRKYRVPMVLCIHCESPNVEPIDGADDYEAFQCFACLKSWGRKK